MTALVQFMSSKVTAFILYFDSNINTWGETFSQVKEDMT